jgi:hypothetical protein
MMYDCYRKDEAHNPEVFSAAVAVILTDFTKEVIDYVTDPRTGLPMSRFRKADSARSAALSDLSQSASRG